MMEMSPQATLSALVDEFDRRGWRDTDQTALKLVRAIQASGAPLDLQQLAQVPSHRFLAVNSARRSDLREMLGTALKGVSISTPHPPLIPIDDIDSFARAAKVSPQEVAAVAGAGKLPIREQTVKEFISTIVGEPYLETDWGGELSDIVTSRVKLDGKRIDAAFLLKGSGFPRKLRPKDLGKNGDQIRRLSKQNVDLFVVQHVGEFDVAVRDQLRDMVLARRAEGVEQAVGSLWDGSDCARLFVAHGLIDPITGQPL